jgi:hypothetical protein
MVAADFLQDPRVQGWLDGVEPAWTLLTFESLRALRHEPSAASSLRSTRSTQAAPHHRQRHYTKPGWDRTPLSDYTVPVGDTSAAGTASRCPVSPSTSGKISAMTFVHSACRRHERGRHSFTLSRQSLGAHRAPPQKYCQAAIAAQIAFPFGKSNCLRGVRPAGRL